MTRVVRGNCFRHAVSRSVTGDANPTIQAGCLVSSVSVGVRVRKATDLSTGCAV